MTKTVLIAEKFQNGAGLSGYVAELASVFLGQTLGFTAHTLEMNAAYLHNWLRVLRSDKGAIFKHAADAQRACDYLIARSEVGRAGRSAEAA
ncbi:DNA primase TraC (plasmid) [Roseovarius indicus]|uniref:DNA primase TraC n=1 Tax=Roseovarius indicus TaxID=540747 RepID=A0A0T5NQZ5_9RHOB|nr:hypothetical protein XM52_28685 [Roseovarius indicus]QEW29463.1 DNA primase TraC [Roseovarius indicus]QEW30038.1 DNA primase TraC [Roseovarius indicus]SFE84584.1 hypothetical protein SAMN04488031_12727 [Roseovarius indicus]